MTYSESKHSNKCSCVRGRISYENFVKALTGDIRVPIEITDFKE
jgi:hypothetical protein